MISTEETRELAQRILDYIEAHPERHNQAHWFLVDGTTNQRLSSENICNTTMCVAGTAIFMTRTLSEFNEFADGYGDWEWEAGRLLGLSPWEAYRLFHSENEDAVELLRCVRDGNAEKFEEIALAEHPSLVV